MRKEKKCSLFRSLSVRNLSLILAGSLAIAGCFLPGCGGNNGENNTSEGSLPVTKLVIGVMPAVDAAPFYLAETRGYYEEYGLDVTIQLFTNAMDRQSALQTNTIDGAMSDMIALITNVQAGFAIKGTSMTDGMFPILVKEGYVEKNEITVAMMEVSVSNYLSDEWLSSDYTVEKVFINEIPARLEMIKAGNVDMGVFPEPMATMGTQDGLKKVIYEASDGFCPDVLVFTQKALREKDQAITGFHRALDRAIEDIRADDGLARDILIEKFGLNPSIRDRIDLPTYHVTRLPGDDYVGKLIRWTENVLNKPLDISSADVFERKYVAP
jgi:NitT/TauT family transport system substrate-binding protein